MAEPYDKRSLPPVSAGFSRAVDELVATERMNDPANRSAARKREDDFIRGLQEDWIDSPYAKYLREKYAGKQFPQYGVTKDPNVKWMITPWGPDGLNNPMTAYDVFELENRGYPR